MVTSISHREKTHGWSRSNYRILPTHITTGTNESPPSVTRRTAARILDDQPVIAQIVNNYSRISFNFGPTLLSWAAEHARDITRADRVRQTEPEELLRTRFGHGAGLQPHDHAARERARQENSDPLGHRGFSYTGSDACRKACGFPKPPSNGELSMMAEAGCISPYWPPTRQSRPAAERQCSVD